MLSESQKQYLKLNLIHILLEKMDGDSENCLRSNLMDSAMNNERLNMGEVVGEMM